MNEIKKDNDSNNNNCFDSAGNKSNTDIDNCAKSKKGIIFGILILGILVTSFVFLYKNKQIPVIKKTMSSEKVEIKEIKEIKEVKEITKTNNPKSVNNVENNKTIENKAVAQNNKKETNQDMDTKNFKEIIVVFKKDKIDLSSKKGDRSAKMFGKKNHLLHIGEFKSKNMVTYKVLTNIEKDIQKTIDTLAKLEEVKSVQLNYQYELQN